MCANLKKGKCGDSKVEYVGRVIKKNRIELFLLLVNSLVIFCVFGGFVFNKHLSSDDFFCYYNQIGEAEAVFFSSYRVVLGAMYYLLDICNINVVEYQVPCGILMLFCFSLSVTSISMVFIKRLEENGEATIVKIATINLGSLMLIINVFVSEWVWFALAYLQWGISILTAVMAAKIVMTQKKIAKKYILSFILLFITAGCYQTCIAIYVFLVMYHIMSPKEKKFGRMILNIVIAAIPAVIGILSNVLIVKLVVKRGYGYVGARVNIDVKTIISQIKLMCKNIVHIFQNGLGLLPDLFFLTVFVIYAIIMIWIFARKKRMLNVFFVFISLVTGIAIMELPLLMQNTFWQPARTVVPIVCILMIMHIEIAQHEDEKKQRGICFAVGSFYLVVNIIAIENCTYDCLKTFAIEGRETKELVNYLKEYEEDNLAELENIVFVKCNTAIYKYYDQISTSTYGGEMALRSALVDWSDIELINYYSDKIYNKKMISNVKLDWEHIIIPINGSYGVYIDEYNVYVYI